MAARAGRAVRDQAQHRSTPPCETCGHGAHEHRELTPTLLTIVGVTVTESPNPAYRPGVFYCHHDDCDCEVAL